MADEQQEHQEEKNSGAGPDLSSFVPETFKGEDGTWKVEDFRRSYDDLAAFKAAEEDRASALPKDPDGYAFALPEDHKLPEGFDPATLATTDEKGNKIEFDPAAMIDKDDPDVAAVKALLHEHKVDPALGKKLAGIMVNREIRQTMEAQHVHAEEIKALGPDAKARIATVTRELNARLPSNYAKAIADSLTSADALRGLEQVIKASPRPTTPVSDKVNFNDLKPADRVHAALQTRKRA